MSIMIRPATLDDITSIVPYLKMASSGFSEFLLAGLVPHMSVDELIEMALTDENTTYYYQQFIVAEHHHQIVGMANFYPSERHELPDLMRSMIPKPKLEIITPYIHSRIPDSMYIHAMAVSASHRDSMCSLLMGKRIEAIAKSTKKKCLSAHVWRENTLAYQGLCIAGFKEIEAFLLAPQPEFTFQGEMVLMKGPDL